MLLYPPQEQEQNLSSVVQRQLISLSPLEEIGPLRLTPRFFSFKEDSVS
jgi:hypothetical protein